MVKKAVFIRCDSSYEIGLGHLMRCLVFASKFKEIGYEVEFICSPGEGNSNHLVLDSGYRLSVLSRVHQIEKDDARECLSLLKSRELGILVVDHYGLGNDWESLFYKRCDLVVIDDLGDRSHYCDVLIDVNFRLNYEEAYKDCLPVNCSKLLGPSYSFLRDEYLSLRNTKANIEEKNILVFFGGSDSTNETGKFLNALANLQVSGCYQVVVAGSHQHIVSLAAMELPKQVKLHIRPPSLAQLMKSSALYLGSGGSITWERMYMGLPGAVVSVADNQERASRELGLAGYQKFLGVSKSVDYSQVIRECEKLANDLNWLKNISKKCINLVSPFEAQSVLNCFDRAGSS